MKRSKGLKRTRKPIDQESLNKMRDFFLSIWSKRLHNCESCNKWLGNEPLSYMFDHLLEKSSHPELKYEEENIMLVCLDCHTNKGNGFPSDITKLRIEKVKKLFGI